MESVFRGIEDVKPEVPGGMPHTYFEAGTYVVEIQNVFLHKKYLSPTRLLIVETIVKESSNPAVQIDQQRNWVINLDSPYALSRIKSFIGAAIQLDPKKDFFKIQKEITAQVCDDVIEKNKLKEKILRLICTKKKSQKGKPYLGFQWQPKHNKND
jgi:hypothetical protein